MAKIVSIALVTSAEVAFVDVEAVVLVAVAIAALVDPGVEVSIAFSRLVRVF